jgi:MarR family transcriptional repressor of mepA
MAGPDRTFSTPMELMRWIGWAQRKAGEDWVRTRELSFEQAFVLGYLRENPGAMQRDIAKISRTSAASVSSLLQGLERRGLVERRTEPGDANAYTRRRSASSSPPGSTPQWPPPTTSSSPR